MATVIDELAMTLSLDPSKFREGTREAEDASQSMASKILNVLQQIEQATEATQKNTADSAKNTMQQHEDHLRKHVDKHREAGQAIEESFKKVGESIKRAGIELLTFMGIEMTVHGMERLFMDLSKADSAAGFLAQTLGVNIRELGEWQGAAKSLGVTANDIAAGMNTIGQEMASLEMKGTSRMVAPLRHMGIEMESSPGVPKDFTQLLLEITDKFEAEMKAGRMRPNEVQMLLNDMGIGQLAPAVMGGGAAMRHELHEQRRIGVATPEDARVSKEMLEAFDHIEQTVESIARKIKTAISPAITDVAKEIYEWLLKNRGWIEEYLIAGLTAVGNLLKRVAQDVRDAFNSAPVQALGTAIGEVAGAVNKLVEATTGWNRVLEGIFIAWTTVKFARMIAGFGMVRNAMVAAGLIEGAAGVAGGVAGTAGGVAAGVGAGATAIVAAPLLATALIALSTYRDYTRAQQAEKLGFQMGPNMTMDDFGHFTGGFVRKDKPGETFTQLEVDNAVSKELKRLQEIADKALAAQEAQLELDKERAAKEDLKENDKYSGRAGGEGEAGRTPGSLTTQQAFTASDMMKDIMRVFEVDQAGAAKIASAAFAESGFKSDVSYGNTPYEYGTDKAVGLFQMTGSRHRELEAFAKERGLDPKDKETQLAHARWEADKSYPGWRKALKSSDPEAFGNLFENGGRATVRHGQFNERFRNMDLNDPTKPVVPEEKPQPPPAPMSPATKPAQHSSLEPRTQIASTRGYYSSNDSLPVPTETAGSFLANKFLTDHPLGASASARRSFSGTMSATDNSRSTETHIGSITVTTQATDALGIARDLKHALQRYEYVVAADGGLR